MSRAAADMADFVAHQRALAELQSRRDAERLAKLDWLLLHRDREMRLQGTELLTALGAPNPWREMLVRVGAGVRMFQLGGRCPIQGTGYLTLGEHHYMWYFRGRGDASLYVRHLSEDLWHIHSDMIAATLCLKVGQEVAGWILDDIDLDTIGPVPLVSDEDYPGYWSPDFAWSVILTGLTTWRLDTGRWRVSAGGR